MKRRLGLVAGLFMLAYLNFVLGWVALPQRLALLLAFGLGPTAILGVLSLSARLETAFSAGTLRAGRIFLIIAFTLLTLMLTIQQAILAEYQRLRTEAALAGTAAALRQTFSLVNHVQLGADMAFDVFYSSGMILISLALVRQSGLPRLVGVYGIGAGIGLLWLNLRAFPTPPALAGTVDLGPFTIVWWVGLILLARGLKPKSKLYTGENAQGASR